MLVEHPACSCAGKMRRSSLSWQGEEITGSGMALWLRNVDLQVRTSSRAMRPSLSLMTILQRCRSASLSRSRPCSEFMPQVEKPPERLAAARDRGETVVHSAVGSRWHPGKHDSYFSKRSWTQPGAAILNPNLQGLELLLQAAALLLVVFLPPQRPCERSHRRARVLHTSALGEFSIHLLADGHDPHASGLPCRSRGCLLLARAICDLQNHKLICTTACGSESSWVHLPR